MVNLRRLIVPAVILAVAYAPMLYAFYRQQWSQPQSQFFPFVIAAYLGLMWWRWEEGEPLPHDGRKSYGALACFGLGWLTLFAGVWLYNPWLSAASFNVFMAGVTLLIAQRRRITYLWGIYALLWLVMPLPLGYDQVLITTLQRLSSRWSSGLLDIVGVMHILQGNTMVLVSTQKQLFVDEACSGITSVMSIIACAVIYGVWRNRTPLHLLLLAIGGVFWATVMNVLRISTIALVLDWFSIDWTKGFSHEMLGLAVFITTFGALLATDLFLETLLAPVLKEFVARTGDAPRYGFRLSKLFDFLATWKNPELTRETAEPILTPVGEPPAVRFSLGWAAAFGLLALTQIGLMGYAAMAPTQAVANVANAEALTQESMPAALGAVRCSAFKPSSRDRGDINGEFSRTYTYEDENGRQYQVSCDFPFLGGWHELTVCYLSVGWDIDLASRKLIPVNEDSENAWSFVESKMSNREGSQGHLVWTMFDEHGQPFAPPGAHWKERLWQLLVRRSPFLPSKQVFQVQVFTAGGAALTPQERDTTHRLLTEARNRFLPLIVNPQPAAAAKPNPAPAAVPEPESDS